VRVTDNGTPVDQLIAAINKSIERASGSGASTRKVVSVELILQIVVSDTVNLGLDFKVPFSGMKLSNGAQVTSEDTLTTYVTLLPPAHAARGDDCGGETEDAILSVVTTIRDAITSASDDLRPLPSESVDIPFAITEAGILAAEADPGPASGVTHTLRLGLASGLVRGW
jgi:hypothetical protein